MRHLLLALTLVACTEEPRVAPARPAPTESSSRPAPTAPPASAAPSVTATAVPSAEGSPEPEGPWPAVEKTWRFDDTPAGRIDVVVTVPSTRVRLPVLIALHGQTEAFKPPDRGARGWLDDYALTQALERVQAPPLTRADLLRIAPQERIAELNAALKKQPYEGLIVVTPFTPDILQGKKEMSAAIPFGRFVVETLIPRIYAETPALGTPESTGIDGVSLGGRVSLLVGLAHPERFGVVAALQPAIYPHELDELTRRIREARQTQPSLRLRLLTSDGDFYRGTVGALSTKLDRASIAHRHDVVSGPHSYAFNRGPGAYEMLLFHDRALRGKTGP